MPRYSLESAVTFSRKWIFATAAVAFEYFSTIATDVSSLQIGAERLAWKRFVHTASIESPYHDVSIAKVSNPLYRGNKLPFEKVPKHLRKVVAGVLKFSIVRWPGKTFRNAKRAEGRPEICTGH